MRVRQKYDRSTPESCRISAFTRVVDALRRYAGAAAPHRVHCEIAAPPTAVVGQGQKNSY